MRQMTLLTLAFTLVLASACASSDATQQTAATMTQSDAGYTGSTGQPATTNSSYGTTASAAPQTTSATVQTTPPRMSRAQRAIEVLRRSPLGRFGRFITGRSLGPANPTPVTTATTTTATPLTAGPPRLVVGQPIDTGGGIKSSVTGTPVEPIPGVAQASATGGSLPAPTTLPSATAVAAGPAVPGAGRVVMGPAVDAGTGIRSTVTGTPVEPIPGVTPTSNQLQPSLATMSPTVAANLDTAGRASAASSPPSTVVSVATPPVAAIAPSEPVPGTKVSNANASRATIKIETAPDGTAVVTNVEEEKPAVKKPAKKATKKRN